MKSLTTECAVSVAGLHRLRHLELTVPSIKDKDVRVLANLPKLEILALREPALTDKQFAMFQKHPTLQSAFINGSRLSEVVVMSVIETLPKLDHLSVGSKNKRLQAAVNQLLLRRKANRSFAGAGGTVIAPNPTRNECALAFTNRTKTLQPTTPQE